MCHCLHASNFKLFCDHQLSRKLRLYECPPRKICNKEVVKCCGKRRQWCKMSVRFKTGRCSSAFQWNHCVDFALSAASVDDLDCNAVFDCHQLHTFVCLRFERSVGFQFIVIFVSRTNFRIMGKVFSVRLKLFAIFSQEVKQ